MSSLSRGSNAFRLLILSIAVLLVAACGGGSSGDDNSNDAGVDAQIDAGPWTFECPSEQPADHVCVRGTVRDILNDEPVNVSVGSTMTMFAAINKDDFPNEEVDETEVQEDGRFIFPSIQMHLTQELSHDSSLHSYHLFSLRLNGIPSTSASTFQVPDNRYGINRDDFDFTYYVVSDGTVSVWEENWEYTDAVFPETWWMDVSAGYKTVIGVCYGPKPNMPPMPVMGDSRGLSEISPVSIQADSGNSSGLLPDRLNFPIFDQPYESGGMGITYIGRTLTAEERVWCTCLETTVDDYWWYYDTSRLALDQFGPEDQDMSSQLVVTHSPIIQH